jgi:succinate dehydrogenase / fumarate reductase cytochrome b subunit
VPSEHSPSAAPARRLDARRLHSLSGLVALGAFLLLHLGVNASAMRGQHAFVEVSAATRLPLVAVLEVVFVALPLAFHALYGLWLWRRPRPDLDRFAPETSWVHGAQRITGLVLVVFVATHVWELRAQRALHGLAHDALYSTMVLHLSSTSHGVPLMAVAYLLGVAAAAFHLAAGLWTYVVGRGVVTGAARTRAGWACAAFGLVLFGVGSGTVVSLATGMHLGRSTEIPVDSACTPTGK